MRRKALWPLLMLLLPLTGRPAGLPWRWAVTLQADPQGVRMRRPTSVWCDPRSGRLYVADPAGGGLFSFSPEGKPLRRFTAGGKLAAPFAMVKQGEERIWVVEKRPNSLTLVDLRRRSVERHRLRLPDGREVFPSVLEVRGESLFVLDRGSGAVLRLDERLRVRCAYRAGGGLIDFKLKPDGLWALEALAHRVVRFSWEGKPVETIALRGTLGLPCSLEVDAQGFIYVLDRDRGRVVVFDRRGTPKYSFLEPGESRGKVRLPIQIRFDGRGRLCVVEEGNGRVEIFQR